MPPIFQKQLTRKHCTLTDDILISAWNDAERIKNCTGLAECVSNLEILNGEFYLDQRWMGELESRYHTFPKNALRSFIERGVKCGEELISFVNHSVDFSLLSPAELENTFFQSLEKLKDLLTFLPFTHPLAKVAEQRVWDILIKKDIPFEDMGSLLFDLSTSEKLNGPQLEGRSLQKIRNQLQLDTTFDVELALKNHAVKFDYLGYREPFSQGYSIDFFRERLMEQKPPSTTHLSPISFQQDEIEKILLLQDCVFFRNYRTEKFYQALYKLESLWKTLARNHGLSETDLGWYRLSECEALFVNGIRIPTTVIEQRKIGYGYLLHNNVIKFLDDTAVKTHLQSYKTQNYSVSILKGMSACKGIVEGHAKIVLSSKDQNKVLPGDILVTSMTTPDFLPSMKRAAAFVTDEGGITCHAAIVSRELGKPCVIGTKQATKVFKDGDLVRVNAETGFIEKI